MRPQGPSNDSPMAARAAPTALAMSASVPCASSPKVSPVLGSMTRVGLVTLTPTDGLRAEGPVLPGDCARSRVMSLPGLSDRTPRKVG